MWRAQVRRGCNRWHIGRLGLCAIRRTEPEISPKVVKNRSRAVDRLVPAAQQTPTSSSRDAIACVFVTEIETDLVDHFIDTREVFGLHSGRKQGREILRVLGKHERASSSDLEAPPRVGVVV